MLQCTKIGSKTLAATWSETGEVNVWDLDRPLQAVNNAQVQLLFAKSNLKGCKKVGKRE